MTEPIWLRRAVLRDMPLILKLQRSAYGEVKWGAFALLLERVYFGEEYIVYTGMTPAGFIHVRQHIQPDRFTLIHVCVRADYQGRGIGRVALSQVMALYQTRGAKRFDLMVRVDNTPAIGLYESLGFREVGVKPHYYKANAETIDGIMMQRMLA